MRKMLLTLVLFTAILLLLPSGQPIPAATTTPTLALPQPRPAGFTRTLEGDALLAPGEILTLFYDEGKGSFDMIPLAEPELPESALEAIRRAPEWLRWKLLRAFEDMLVVELDDRLTGARTSRPALADFNGDGLLDLFVGLSNGEVMYFENIGTSCRPLFLDKSDLMVRVEVSPEQAPPTPAPVDLNGDGLVDLAVGCKDGTIRFWWNRGTPTHPVWVEASNLFGGIDVGDYATPFFTDLDGDGLMDLVVGNGLGELRFYWNRGSPTAPSWVEDDAVFEGLPPLPMAVPVLARLSGEDGPLWLVVGLGNGTVCFFRNVGTELEPEWELVEGITEDLDVSNWAAVSVGDLNGDGKPDLVIGNNHGDVFWARNEGTLEEPLFISHRHHLEEIIDEAAELISTKPPQYVIEDPVFFFKWYLDVFYTVHYAGTGRPWYGYYPDLDKLRVTREHYQDYVDFMARFLINVSEHYPDYVDEIAYWMAHEQVNLLRTIAYYALREDKDITGDYILNVQTIYETADKLPYVRIVEHPEANYTTVAYRTENGTWVEVDPLIYYQYLVMPTWNTMGVGLRLNDYYEGHFFRTTLLYDDRYGPTLYEIVSNATTPYQAAKQIHYWSWYIIRARWDNQGSWRVRGWWQIWTHLDDDKKDSEIVMCGEFATITECWLRAALIPAVESSNMGEDHVWDEFYDPEHGWVHMDTTGPPESYFDNPRLYEEGWRKDVSAVFWSDHAGRYDHPLLSSLNYTVKARVVFKVRDANGQPVDGVRVEAWSHWLIPRYGFAFMSFYNYTNEDGEATLYLGYNNYTFLVASRYGYVLLGWPYPNGTTIYENQTYTFEITLPRAKAPRPSLEGTTGLPEVLSQYHLAFNVELVEAYQFAPDVYGIYQYYRYQDVWSFGPGEGAYVSIYVLDEDNYRALLSGHDFTALMASEMGTSLSLEEKPIPEELLKELRIVVSNAHSEATYKHIRFNITVVYDDKPPEVTISYSISDSTVTVFFSSPDPDVHHFEISIDNGPWQPATSPYVIEGLPEGTHTVRVRAIDISGLVGESSATFTIRRPGPAIPTAYAIAAGVGVAVVVGGALAFLRLRRRA